MKNKQGALLTPNEFTLTLVSSMLGVGILYIPNGLIKYAKQDAWISCIVGAVYPLYMLVIAKYLSSKFPEENLLDLSKRCFGKFFGNILNILFVSFFIFVLSSEISGFSNVFKTYVVNFLNTYKIISVTLLAVIYIACKGIKPLARVNVIIFYLTLILMFIPSGSLINGTILNIMPVFETSIVKILQASRETAFFYTGFEVVFLIYPFLEQKQKLFKYGMTSIIFLMFLYVWTVFLTIYYLGIEISPKYLWPVLGLTDSINIPVVNSFRFIFMSLWALIILKCMSTYCYSIIQGISQILTKVSTDKIAMVLYPIIVILSLAYGNTVQRKEVTGKLIPIYVLFNLFFITITAFAVKMKRGDVNEKK
ncbi:GerAB/ArcD/ProY family transporter [Clostridium fungisolvens]|uniref:Spore germination protein YndE n=1 Tax=Clostridium fungisolvens TaxID=1604897 RepID=A0A6V8SLH2_9CLOT|nr:GerAB/ArcD/ProY family transporter [Clostridium fungisolvens]GFP77402.1 Spore germination protein YndE [Clostridium fungisolvens]